MTILEHHTDEPLHVLDLPQLYQRPSATDLLSTLDLLAVSPPQWDQHRSHYPPKPRLVNSKGLTPYLTRIIGSPLTWIASDALREEIWELASKRLSERSGRTAMGSLTRSFSIKTSVDKHIQITIHEPALTGDNLGLKTWASAHVLASHLHTFSLPPQLRLDSTAPKVLELGAGTGLVGLAAAAVWGSAVVLTDLAAIVPNLQRNADANSTVLGGVEARCAALDWNEPGRMEGVDAAKLPTTYPMILAADPLYSPEHPRMLVGCVVHRLERVPWARFWLAYPVREAYVSQVEEVKKLLVVAGLVCVQESSEWARDDWAEAVHVVNSMWMWAGEQFDEKK